MAKINNSALANVIRTFDADPNGEVWAAAKAVVTPENEANAKEVLAADATFVKLAKANAKAKEARRKSRPAPEPGTLKHTIATYTKADKTETFVKKDGTTIACTPAQKRTWEAGRERFEVVNAERAQDDTKVTQDTKAEAIAKALADKPELLEVLEGLLK